MLRTAMVFTGLIALISCRDGFRSEIPAPPALTGYYRADPATFGGFVRLGVTDQHGPRILPASWVSLSRPARDTLRLVEDDSVEIEIALFSTALAGAEAARTIIGFRTRPEHDYEIVVAVQDSLSHFFCIPTPLRAIPVTGSGTEPDTMFIWLHRYPREPLPPC